MRATSRAVQPGADDWGDRVVVLPRARTRAELARDHRQALHIGSEVTRWFRQEREPQVLQVSPDNVLASLHRAGINPVLMGTHGINVYRDQARATQDVDVLEKLRRLTEQAQPSGGARIIACVEGLDAGRVIQL